MLHPRLLVLFLSLDVVCYAQTFDSRGITSGGGHGSGGQASLSYAVGQFSGRTAVAPTAVLTAGVQQPARVLLRLNIRAFLAGPYDANNGLMWDGPAHGRAHSR